MLRVRVGAEITDWRFTIAEFTLMLVWRRTLCPMKTCEFMGWKVNTYNTYMRGIVFKMNAGNMIAAHVLFDRWADVNADKVDELKRTFLIEDGA